MTGIIKRIFTPHVEAEPVWQSELFVFCYVFHLIILISLCDYAICIDGFGVNVSPLIILYCTCAWATYNEHQNWDHTYYEYAKNKRRWTMKEKSRQLDAITYTKHGDASLAHLGEESYHHPLSVKKAIHYASTWQESRIYKNMRYINDYYDDCFFHQLFLDVTTLWGWNIPRTFK